MSGQITDELREWAYNVVVWNGNNCARLAAIADRIDAEHERAVRYERCAFWHDASDDELANYGLLRAPIDAHGEYIHIGDTMAYEDNTKPMEVVALVPPAVFITDEGPRYADMCRHYKPPTTEDVLREFAEKITDSQIPGVHPTYEEAIVEYAKRLMLAGDADE